MAIVSKKILAKLYLSIFWVLFVFGVGGFLTANVMAIHDWVVVSKARNCFDEVVSKRDTITDLQMSYLLKSGKAQTQELSKSLVADPWIGTDIKGKPIGLPEDKQSDFTQCSVAFSEYLNEYRVFGTWIDPTTDLDAKPTMFLFSFLFFLPVLILFFFKKWVKWLVD